jgi:hypothetical protein
MSLQAIHSKNLIIAADVQISSLVEYTSAVLAFFKARKTTLETEGDCPVMS